MITAFVLIDTLMERLNHHTAVRAQVPDSEVILKVRRRAYCGYCAAKKTSSSAGACT
jgi:hypothetical protein